MHFESFSAALAMEGHGGFVWSVVAISLVIIVSLLLGPILVNRRIQVQQRGALRREEAAQHHREATDGHREEQQHAPGA